MAACAPAPRLRADLSEALDRLVPPILDRDHVPGAVIAIGDADGVRVERVYGLARVVPTPALMTVDTLFDLASLTKVVGTATAIMALEEDGRLSLDDPVSRSIPGFAAPDKAPIVLRDLLTHASGLPAYITGPEMVARYGPGPQPTAVVAAIAAAPLLYPIRSGYTYSCLNYISAARVAERAAGEPLDAYLRQRIYRPLGMNETGFGPPPEAAGRCAATEVIDGAPLQGVVHDPLAQYYGCAAGPSGNAGLFATARDLARYARMILRDGELDGIRVLRRETVERMTRPQSVPGLKPRAIGWDLYETPPWQPRPVSTSEPRAIGHTGYTGTFLWIDRASGVFVVLLTNRVHPDDSGKVEPLRKAVLEATTEFSRLK